MLKYEISCGLVYCSASLNLFKFEIVIGIFVPASQFLMFFAIFSSTKSKFKKRLPLIDRAFNSASNERLAVNQKHELQKVKGRESKLKFKLCFKKLVGTADVSLSKMI